MRILIPLSKLYTIGLFTHFSLFMVLGPVFYDFSYVNIRCCIFHDSQDLAGVLLVTIPQAKKSTKTCYL